jgi:hypothetical protein
MFGEERAALFGTAAEHLERVPAPVRQGDLVSWRTWSGRAVVLLVSVGRDGACTVRSADGHDEFLERVPATAALATAEEAHAFRAGWLRRWADRDERSEYRGGWHSGPCDGCESRRAQRVRTLVGSWGAATVCAHHAD